ncbi:MAG: S41 family peptidase [Paludibacter sp.]|nr:S41 family peptidase [Paludibacter sp.]
MKKYLFVLLALFLSLSCVFGKEKKKLMFSNKQTITFKINEEGINEWVITPELNPDVLNLYSANGKAMKVKFVSDIDSVSFIVKANKPAIHFGIVLNKKDTAWTEINLTNKIANTLSDKEKIFALSYFWSEAKYNFVFIDKLKFDFDSLYQAFIPEILNTKNDFEFYDKMEIFAASLKDLHTGIYYNENIYTDYIPISARFFGEQLQVVSVRDDLAEKVPVGSIILKINDLETKKYLEKFILPHIISDFEPTVKMLAASRLFSSDLISKKIKITYKTPQGQILTADLPRDGNSKSGNHIGYHPSYPSQPIEIIWEEGQIARLQYNTFYPSEKLIPLFESIKDTLYNAKGLIIDLRYNRGGSTDVAENLLQYIIKDKYFLEFGYQTRINNGLKKAHGNFVEDYEDFYKDRAFQTFPPDTVFIADSVKRFDIPTVILISERTCSAAEDFLIMLKERADRPMFIGRTTMGSTGSPLVLSKWNETGMARICTVRVLYPYSQKPFIEGIAPDILVEYSLDELLESKYDKDVKIAAEYLLKKQVE